MVVQSSTQSWYYVPVIVNFASLDAELIFNGKQPRRLPNTITAAAIRKLRQLNAAVLITDLREPRGNHLELLSGDRIGQHSIRINDQYRICFRWVETNTATVVEGVEQNTGTQVRGSAHDVAIVDYH